MHPVTLEPRSDFTGEEASLLPSVNRNHEALRTTVDWSTIQSAVLDRNSRCNTGCTEDLTAHRSAYMSHSLGGGVYLSTL